MHNAPPARKASRGHHGHETLSVARDVGVTTEAPRPFLEVLRELALAARHFAAQTLERGRSRVLESAPLVERSHQDLPQWLERLDPRHARGESRIALGES